MPQPNAPRANRYDIGKVIDELSDLIHMAQMYMQAVHRAEQLLARNQPVFDLSPAFFDMALNSMKDRTRTFLMRLFDTHPMAISVNCLLRLVEETGFRMANADQGTVERAVKRHRARLKRLSRPIQAIRDHRNMRLAHRDWTLAWKGQPPRPARTANDRQITRALKAVAEIVLEHSLFYDNRSRALYDSPVGWDDLDELLRTARRGVKATEEDWRNERS